MDWKEQRDISKRDGAGILAFLVKALAFKKMITYEFNEAPIVNRPSLKDFFLCATRKKSFKIELLSSLAWQDVQGDWHS